MNGIKAKRKNRIIAILSLFLFLTLQISSQEKFKVMFYNVENLYDTINNPKTLDDDLTPDGNLHWNSYRYQKKLEDISKVISSLGGKHPPAIVGLCEIENQLVLENLTKHSSLTRHKYKYVITNSKDNRGSNIALLYQRDQMKLLEKKTYTPNIGNDIKTRDILHVTVKVVSGDTLDLFICHFPSRSEGIRKSEPYRIAVAKLLRNRVDNIFGTRNKANIIIMGDFNDYPYDKSMQDILGGKSIKEEIRSKELYNMFLHLGKNTKDIASYKYQSKWGYLDQFIISGNLLHPKSTMHIIDNKAQIFSPDFLLEEDTKHGGEKPYRTYSGWKYLGGTSDHLPIHMDLFIKE